MYSSNLITERQIPIMNEMSKMLNSQKDLYTVNNAFALQGQSMLSSPDAKSCGT